MRRSGLVVVSICLLGLTLPFSQSSQPVIFTVAGGGPDHVPLASGDLGDPQGLFYDAAGNLHIIAHNRIYGTDASGTLRVLVGSGASYFSGDGGPALEAALQHGLAAAQDAAGNFVIADPENKRIRMVDAATGIISSIVGTGIETGGIDGPGGDPADDLGDGGPAGAATLRHPGGVAVSPSGDLIIADSWNHRVRQVSAVTGIITTIAGTGIASNGGDGGAATSAGLNDPRAVVFGPDGSLLIVDHWNNRIRRLDMSTGIITTVAGTFTQGYWGDGGPATEAALNHPQGIAFDALGNLLIADTEGERIRRVDSATGIISTIAGIGRPTGYLDGDGNDPTDDYADGIPATEATLSGPTGVAVDGAGNILIADSGNDRIRRVDLATGVISAITSAARGDGTFATLAPVYPYSAVADSAGNIYIGDYQRLRRVDAASGMIQSVAGCSGDFAHCNDDDGRPPLSTILDTIGALVTDASDQVYVAANAGNIVWRYSPQTHEIQRVAGGGGAYFTSSDGGPATEAGFGKISGLAFDSAGHLYVAHSTYDSYDPLLVRKVDTVTGTISTVAGAAGSTADGVPAANSQIAAPGSLAIDAADNLYIVSSLRVRRVDAQTGIITTVAGNGTLGASEDGGPATQTSVAAWSIAVDSDNGLLIADSSNDRIRRVDLATGIISTVAGTGEYGFSGDIGPAAAARLASPDYVSALPNGGFLLTDGNGTRVRMVTTAAGGFPAADAGPDQTLECTQAGGTPVLLDGSGSSSDAGSALTYAWMGPFPERSGLVDGVAPMVTLPIGPSQISLMVRAGGLPSRPDDVAIAVHAQVTGLGPHMSSLVPEGVTPSAGKRVRRGAPITLKLALRCGAEPLGKNHVEPPRLVGLRRSGQPVPVPALNGHGGSQTSSDLFRAKGARWSYVLKTASLQAGDYEAVIRTPDSRLWSMAFTLK